MAEKKTPTQAQRLDALEALIGDLAGSVKALAESAPARRSRAQETRAMADAVDRAMPDPVVIRDPVSHKPIFQASRDAQSPNYVKIHSTGPDGALAMREDRETGGLKPKPGKSIHVNALRDIAANPDAWEALLTPLGELPVVEAA